MTETFSGSCLCNTVTYKVTGEAVRFYHCHCQRCRKVTGSGHATNIMIKPETELEWLSGEASLGKYKVPEAERFYNCFCTQCGSPMPRVVPQLDAVIIAAGTLDAAPSLKPQARIFWDSRAEWSCANDGLVTFSEYPPDI
ncbi:GFA family protein [Beggiatoa alba]|nr:GFA family protein [Beggiatoa alba]